MRLPLRILACLVLTALPTAASARRLVEPGDALVGTGAAIHVVRGDGLGVAPFTPREGVFVNRLVAGGGVVVDAVSGHVFAASNPAQGARIVMVDPDSGEQTNLTEPGDALPDLQDRASGLDVLLNGGLLVATWGEQVLPPVNTAAVRSLSPPTTSGVTAASYIGSLSGGPFSVYGLAAAQAESGSEPQILTVAVSPDLPLVDVDWTAGGSTPITGTPVQAEAIIPDLDYRCAQGPVITTCTRYWVEARIDDQTGDCVPSDAALYSYNPLTDLDTLFVGPPLRCPVAIERAPDGSLLVIDGETGPSEDTAFVDLRLYRFTHQGGGVWAPTLLADGSELPDSGPLPPALAVSTVALPEPDAAGAALSTLLGVVWSARRRARSRSSGPSRARRA